MKLPIFKNDQKHSLLITLLLAFLTLASQGVFGALIKPESVLFQVLEKNQNVFQFYVETKVGVFDPEAFAPLNEAVESNLKPYEKSEQSYYQNIVFVRDEFISIETLNQQGKALHIYMEEIGGKKFSANLDENRSFNDEDVLLPCLTFFTKHVEMLEHQLYQYEIVPDQVSYEHQQYLILYRLGSNENNVKIDPNTFKVLEMQNQIQIEGRYYPLEIVFSDWNPTKDVIPEVTRYYVNSRLFKESRITAIQFSRIYSKRNEILKKYQSLFPPNFPFRIDNIYGQ